MSGDHRTRHASAAPLAGDILSGANEIAEFIYGDRKYRRKVYNLVETNCLPVFRLGANICARRSILLSWIAKQERTQRL
ncbi:DNA-binding protein [Rhodopseudomonas sp. BR0C11]|nr:DNA-binding protein [Rhodopseudomonas sp. BR0C11]